MIIKLDPGEMETLKSRLETDEAAEKITESEYVLDAYDFDPPLTMEIELCKDGVDILACERLEFSEEMDGWYVAGRIKDEDTIKKALTRAPGEENA